MEKWRVAFLGQIPSDYYSVLLRNGEKRGLTVELQGLKATVVLDFGFSQAVRMLDEGIVQNGVYSDEILQKYQQEHFRDVVYVAENGSFEEEVRNMALGMWEALTDSKHYIIFTQNYCIDIISWGDPTMEVKLKK